MSTETKRYASTRSSWIGSLVNGGFRFRTVEAADKHLEKLRARFIFASSSWKESKSIEGHREILWIRGFKVSERNAVEGYIGNYGEIKRELSDLNECILILSEVQIPLSAHPQKARPQGGRRHKHPNWGHPVLRKIRQGKNFRSMEKARQALYDLCKEYEDTSIPSLERFFVIVFSREYGDNPTKKFIFQPVEREGRVFIDYYENPQKNPIERRRFAETIDRVMFSFDDYPGSQMLEAPEEKTPQSPAGEEHLEAPAPIAEEPGLTGPRKTTPQPQDRPQETGAVNQEAMSAKPAEEVDPSLAVLADQHWLRLTRKRLDLSKIKAALGVDRSSVFVVGCPDIPPLAGFRRAIVEKGWDILDTPNDSGSRIPVLVDFLDGLPAGTSIKVITGDEELIGDLEAAGIKASIVNELGNFAMP